MASDVGIVNSALSKLGEEPILSFTDDTTAGRLANRTYEEIRDSMIAEHPWNFASQRASLAAEGTSPEWGFDNQYPLPTDFLRLLDVSNSTHLEYRVENKRILTDIDSPLKILYLRKITDANAMPPTFREALAARLAQEWAIPLTQNATLQGNMAQLYTRKFSLARAVDAQEDHHREIEAVSFLEVR